MKMSSTSVRKLKHSENGLELNGGHIRTVDLLYSGDVLTINMPEEKSEIPATHFDDLVIVYEDEDILVINKPPFLAMHPTHNHQGDTLANEVAAYMLSKGKEIVFRAVGRLDKCTSGLVVCALNRHASSFLAGNTNKEYLAFVEGEYKSGGTVDRPIIRPDPGKTLRAVGEGGERAVTRYEPVLCADGISLLRITLETGRTHQIRVHFSSLGTPLCGDEMYGGHRDIIGRAALHCAKMSFVHPVTKEKMTFEAPLYEDMQKIYDSITGE